jgi:2-polyprenyl-3-methyl-5-hydroxy-6-metoxy-1,4-benzoquinol methylase
MCVRNRLFDAVLSWSVIDHVEEGPQRALFETYRVLKPGGLLFITVPCNNLLDIFLSPLYHLKKTMRKSRVLRKLMSKGTHDANFFQHEFSRRQILFHLVAAGFAVRTVMPFSHEYGFARSINRVFIKNSKLFHKNKQGYWDGLTHAGRVICQILKSLSTWISPDEVFVIAVKK